MLHGGAAMAGELYVDSKFGRDTADGLASNRPFKTINKAIADARAGDTIHILPTEKICYQGI